MQLSISSRVGTYLRGPCRQSLPFYLPFANGPDCFSSQFSPSFWIFTASRTPLSLNDGPPALVIATVVALVAARFAQEGLVQQQIAALFDFGEPGQAVTLAGQSPGVLLGGANACDKVRDQS